MGKAEATFPVTETGAPCRFRSTDRRIVELPELFRDPVQVPFPVVFSRSLLPPMTVRSAL